MLTGKRRLRPVMAPATGRRHLVTARWCPLPGGGIWWPRG